MSSTGSSGKSDQGFLLMAALPWPGHSCSTISNTSNILVWPDFMFIANRELQLNLEKKTISIMFKSIAFQLAY
jgi:hypothetical protein